MKDNHGYILRYYLPLKPHFDEEYTKLRFNELLEYCKSTKIDAVMFYVALDPNWYYMPAKSEYEAQVCSALKPYANLLKAQGISYQLNFQNLLGAVHGGGNFTDKLGYEEIVDYKGNTALGVACPLGEKFRKDTELCLKLWAETHPDIIWIDDDFRLHNHGASTLMKVQGKSGYADFYCFCDEHIKRFNAIYHTAFDRETLVREMLSKGEPSTTRIKYLEFLKDTMTETAGWISGVVHGVDKNIKIAQMTSNMEVHAVENRDWKGFLTALSGEHKPIIRPHFGPYKETDPKDFTACYSALAKSMTAISSAYGEGVEYGPEIENTRFTAFSKSASATAYQLGLSAFMGAKSTTLSLYDLDGGSFSDEPSYGKMLKDMKPLLGKITALGLDNGNTDGVICPLVADAGKRYKLSDGDEYSAMTGKNSNIDRHLTLMGVPCRYSASVFNEKGTFAIDGYSANILTDDEINYILSQSVLLDGMGAKTLFERGFGDKIGVNSVATKTTTVNIEIINKFTRTDGTFIRIPSRIPPKSWYKFDYHSGVKILSNFSTCEGEISPALTTFNNDLGGKVAIYPAFNDWGDGFYNGYRLRLFKEVLSEDDENLPTILADKYILSVVKEKGDEKFYFIANLSTDRLEEIKVNGKKVKTDLLTYGFTILKEKGKTLKKLYSKR